MSSPRIEPRVLKGFRDYPPEVMLPRERLMDRAKEVYRSFGFSPIDTPALEYTEILLGKGGAETDKQLYRFTDHGGRDVALRFDLTVPFARFAAQHIGQLGKPFKRYHIGPVWRGEKPARGRFREFIQCDFDSIGTESMVADIETALVIHELMTAIGFEKFTIRVNNRRVLTGILEGLDLIDQTALVLRALDKLEKIGPDKVRDEMTGTAGISTAQAQAVLDAALIEGTNEEILARLDPMLTTETGRRGHQELEELVAGARAAGVVEGRLRLDITIARGLDYYTGTIYETQLDELPGIGSVCSGGRYDDLASLYTKERLPGVGASLGIDRLLAALEELGRIESRTTPAPVLVAFFDASRRADYLALATKLRRDGIGTELYPEPKKLGAQLKYADRRGFKLAIIVGETEFEAGTCQIKDLTTGQSEEVSLAEAAAACKRRLG